MPAPWAAGEAPRTNGTSRLALFASLSGFLCLFGVGGALGIVLGLIAHREIARAPRPEKGRGLANAAIALGVANVGLTVIALAIGITYLARPSPPPTSRSAPALTPPSGPLPAPSTPRKARRNAPKARASRESGTQVTELGTIRVADISGDFEAALEEQRARANAGSEVLILWLVVPNCKPCDGVSAALSDAAAQKALARVRFARANRDEFQEELERLGIPTEKIPGFVLLDAQNHARDFIHGGEWDADIPANILPVLGRFAHGAYKHRREPWRGPAREDETPL